MRAACFFAIAIGGCWLDLWTKHTVFAWRGMPRADNVHWLVEGYLGVETALNNGAIFGIGQGLTAVFATLSVIAGIGILIWYFAAAWTDRLLSTALAGILAGIGGNLYDRLGLWTPPGMEGMDPVRITRVRDWILMCWGEDYVWPNYNIADCFLVGGAALLMIHLCFFDGSADTKDSDAADEAADANEPG